MLPFPLSLPRLQWISLPGMLLLTLLQRAPALRLLVAGTETTLASPIGQIMRSVFTAAALGALHSRAGATTFSVTQGTREIIRVSTVRGSTNFRTPATGATSTAFTPVGITYTATPSPPQYYAITGQLPPGLSFVPAAVNGVVRSGTPAIIGTPSRAGSFTVRVQGFGLAGNGQPEAIDFVITGAATDTAPAFTTQPSSQTVSAGATVTFTADASGSPAPAFQWRRNGVALPGATAATLTLTGVQLADAGDYSVAATNAAGSATSANATLTVIAANPNARLANLSVRTRLDAGQPLIVGVVVDDGSREILVRAAGPALGQLGVDGTMENPRLELFNGATSEFTNDDWPGALAPTFAGVGAFPFPNASRDAAFVRSLRGAYSIQAGGPGAGIVLVEAYDTGAPTAARLVNVSARNRVGTGDDLLIAGFTIGGTGSKPLLIRAVGPTLGAFGVTGTLFDPKLEIYDGRGTKVTENDTWSAALAPTFASVGAFALVGGSRDAALVASLPPGGYTAQVRGADGGTGEALIEIYELK